MRLAWPNGEVGKQRLRFVPEAQRAARRQSGVEASKQREPETRHTPPCAADYSTLSRIIVTGEVAKN